MEIRIGIGGSAEDAGQTLVSLHRWVSQDWDTTRHVRLSLVTSPPRSGEMGADVEAISAVFSSAVGLGSLVLALLSWRGSRLRPPVLRIERDGVVVELRDDAPDPEAVRRIVEALSPPPPAPEDPSGQG